MMSRGEIVAFQGTLETLRSNDADGNEKVKKKGLRSKTTTSHFFVHFFPVFARLGRENALFRVYGGR